MSVDSYPIDFVAGARIESGIPEQGSGYPLAPTRPGETRRRGGQMRWKVGGLYPLKRPKTGEMASPKTAIGGVRTELDPQEADVGTRNKAAERRDSTRSKCLAWIRRRGVLPPSGLAQQAKHDPVIWISPCLSSDVRSRLQQRQNRTKPEEDPSSKVYERTVVHSYISATQEWTNGLGFVPVCHWRSRFGCCERHGDQAIATAEPGVGGVS